MALLLLYWLGCGRFPVAVRVHESGEQIGIPLSGTVSFGRLAITGGMTDNGVGLALPDALATLQISRWHVALRRRPRCDVPRSVSTHPTTVAG